MKQKTIFDEENRLELLSRLGDPLEILNKVIKWEMFRSVLNQACRKEDTGKGGRPPYEVVMMFKILVLQRLYNLSADQTEYQINDRMSFMRFLGINLCDKVPDAKTIWKFKNDLAEAKARRNCFALFMGMVDFSAFNDVQIIARPHLLPFKLEFNASAIIGFILIFLVSATETIGDTSALASSGLGRDVTEKETAGSIACDGFVSSISSLFGCMPITSFSQDVGLVAMTKVVNRYAIATGAGIMVLAGFFPAVGALLATLPSAVLGGCTIMMFGTIVVSGLQMIGKCGFTQRNITIAALSLSVGLGFTQCPEMFAIFPDIVKTVFAENCVAVVFVTSILLNLILPKDMETGRND